MKVVILGYGVRGRTYAAYAAAHPSEYEIAAIADPCLFSPAGGGGGVPARAFPGARVFADWADALETPADAAIVALPDRLHCEAAEAALSRGLHVLLEKPIGCSMEECERIRAAQRASRRLVLTGYVLRFAAYYRRLREILRSDAIGEITAISHSVAIGCGKAAHAFCRGNWAREADGTSTIVQKCTHDFDLVVWWTGGKRPQRIASFGSLAHWRPEARPPGAAERCLDCDAATRANCPFDAVRLYVEEKDLRYHFPDESDEAMREVVATSRYGRCVYCCGNDAVNRQSVIMEYPGGLLVTLEMQAFTAERRRTTRFYGTRGEIFADGEKIETIPFVGERRTTVPEQHGAHGGGDREIMAEFARLAKVASPERYSAILDASLESHILAFAAEKSRKGSACAVENL